MTEEDVSSSTDEYEGMLLRGTGTGAVVAKNHTKYVDQTKVNRVQLTKIDKNVYVEFDC